MPKVVLTDKAITSAKPADGNRLELWDLRTAGLCLRITGRGVRTWIFRYRTPDGRQPRFTIGKMPAIGLKEAREQVAKLEREVALGGDPATARRAARNVQDAPKTFDELADAYFAACESGEWKPKGKRKRPHVIRGERDRVRLHVSPGLGKRPFATIMRPDVKSLLRKMTAKGIGAQTNLTQAIIRQIYNFAISDDLVLVNPATGFAPFADTRPRSRIWTDKELASLWAALDDPANLLDEEGKAIHVSEQVRIAIKLLALLGQRRGEVIGMERSELDLRAKTWLIEGRRMKGSRPHMVPLPNAAIPLIERAIMLSDAGRAEPSAYVFATDRIADKAIMPASVTHAITRLKVGLGIKGPTVHDLRRTMSTNMTSERCGVSPFIRSKVLGHIDAGGGALVSSIHYDSNTYIGEKRRALETWADLLSRIVRDSEQAHEPAGSLA
ncbi:tyrosine-type recombinase/integrase [Brevundimonas sp. BR2-1]|uniref:tyrosine-type recombinase/integrase n=1 Tax=Brevundimonas sp. BR2-1 TaxID=3031123 RepID=UPI0030AB2C88